MLATSYDTSKPFDVAFERTWNQWIPGNISVVLRVERKLESGNYTEGPKEILEDLHQDIGIYLFVIRELVSLQQKARNTQLDEVTKIKHAIRTAKSKLCTEDNKYRLQNAEPFQLEILRESYLTSVTVSQLCQAMDGESRLADTVSTLRSMGRMLLAWNYPKEFSEAVNVVEESSDTIDIDQVLTKKLGFAPSTLGARVAAEIGFNKDIQALIEPSGQRRTSTPTPVSKKIASICRISECFAYANSNIPYNVTSNKVKESINIIEKTLGPKKIAELFEEVNSLCESYRELFPDSFTTQSVDLLGHTLYDGIAIKKLAKDAGLSDKNNAALILARNGTKGELYHGVSKLFKEILPELGVSASAVMVLSPVERTLTPIFKRGHATFAKITETPVYQSNTVINSLRSAFLNKQGEQIEGHDIEGQRVFACIQPVDQENPLGVLYLESLAKQVEIKQLVAISKYVQFILSRLYYSDE